MIRLGLLGKSATQREDFIYPYLKCSSDICKKPYTRKDQVPTFTPYIEGTCPNCGAYGFGSSEELTYSLFAGTAWAFASEKFDQFFDYIFIDEAGQLTLPHTIAVGSACDNLVLIGAVSYTHLTLPTKA